VFDTTQLCVNKDILLTVVDYLIVGYI